MPMKIEFSTSNAVFGDDASGPDASEIAACLEQVIKAYSNGANSGAVRDVNGNTIGQWSATIEAEGVEVMASLADLHDAMWRYNLAVTYGSECTAWGDFVADCYQHLGVGPWHDQDPPAVPKDFAEYWQTVADGESADYAADTGNRIGLTDYHSESK